MNICHIMGAGEPSGAIIQTSPGDLIIAADGGYAELKRQNKKPDLVVGDFDSLGSIPEGETIVRHPVMKDDTDMLLAVKIGLERGYSAFHIHGALGGRLDHTLANIQVLSYIAERGARGFLIGKNECVTAIHNSSLAFSAEASGTISVFCLGARARGVTLEGLLYPLTNHTLTPDFPLGVSNEFTGAPARVRVEDGTLIIIFPSMNCLL